MANPYRATTQLALMGVLIAASAPWTLAAELGLRLAAEAPQRGPYAPATTGYPTEPSELSAAIAVLGALGLDALVVEPLATEAADSDAGTRSAAGLPEGAAERARLEIILAAADEAGIDVYLEGFDVLGSAEPTEAEAELIGDAISGALRYLGEHDSLAGFIWRAPEPLPLAGTPLPAEVAAAADAWIRSMQALVTTLGNQCAEAGRTFVIATDSVPLVAAALPVLPPGVEVWRTATDLRDPTLEPQIAALEAATGGDAGGLWLDWEVPHGAGVSRAACMGLAAGCGTVIAGDVSLALHADGIVPEDLVAGLAAFAAAPPASRGPAQIGAPYPDAVLLLEPATVLAEKLAPPETPSPDQVTGSLIMLNESGRSVAMAFAPPATVPQPPQPEPEPEPDEAPAEEEEEPRDPRDIDDELAEEESEEAEEDPVEPEAPRPPPMLVLCDAARATDAYLDALFESTDRGFTTVVYADMGTEDLFGGARARESRDRQDARLPMDRSRLFRQPVSRVVVMKDLEGTNTRSGRELEAAAAEGQWIFRGKAREGSNLLAEWFEPSAPAFVSAPRGAGRVLVYNGAPGLSRVNLFGQVLTHMGVPVTRPEEVDPEDEVEREEPEGLGRHGLVPNFPYEKPIPVEVIPPPSLDPTLQTAESEGSYDAYIVGPGGTLYAFGYRAPRSGSFRRVGGIETFMGPWDMVAVRGDAYLTTSRESRLPKDLDAHVYEPVASDFAHVIYKRGGDRTVCPGPGLYLLTVPLSDHALVATDGAKVVRAHRLADDDALLLEVDRPAILELALDPEVFAGQRAQVSLADPDARGLLPLGSAQWRVTWDNRMFIDALGRVPVLVSFSPAREETARASVMVEPGANALPVRMDGEQAVLLDRYADASAVLRFEHWAPPEERNTLSIIGVQGDLYGDGERGHDAPAKLRVTVNGTEVYHSEAPYMTYRADGVREEWSALAIPVPKEALRRGHNLIIVENGGPNAVAIASATIRFERPAEE